MQASEDLVKRLPRVEPVEWLYDGIGGKIIAWTKQQGNTNDDPSVLIYLVASDGTVAAVCPPEKIHAPKALAEWLDEQVAAYETARPRLKVPFVRTQVIAKGDGDARDVTCPAFDEAVADRRLVAVYVSREERPGDDRKTVLNCAVCRRFEKETLGAEAAGKAAKGWVLLRLDLAEPDHALFAQSLGVEEAPTIVLVVPDVDKPILLGARTDSTTLAYHLKKYAR